MTRACNVGAHGLCSGEGVGQVLGLAVIVTCTCLCHVSGSDVDEELRKLSR